MNERFQRRLSAGEVLFQKQDRGDCAYIVESGTIEICHDPRQPGGVVARLGPQDIFGEMALFGEGRRSAGARATEPTVLTVVSHEYLGEHLQGASPTLRHLLRTLTARCRELLTGKTGEIPAAAGWQDEQDRKQAHARVHAQQELTLALECDELELHYQPIVHLSDLRLAGFEALLRWRHPQRGMVSPAEFIPLAEESGLISPIGRWIVDRACAALAQFGSERPELDLFMSINLSSRQFDDPELLPAIDQALSRHAVDPACVKLEITESLLLQRLDEGLRLLQECRARGLKISLDDFGTGYSSLSYLHRLPVDTLKLDRSFVLQLGMNAAGTEIVAAVVGLAHRLGMDVITEGLETQEQIDALRTLGADLGQGFHFGRAEPLAGAAEIVRKSL
ncbi:EAL domain-containing protein [Nevskia soli]|uniref:EAL domain-containing protein n=1 Tax=Nevskia soli TaxID=418856 RepID=UPI00068A91D8|nr:EAL domain-containing protein [Nevskia soli]